MKRHILAASVAAILAASGGAALAQVTDVEVGLIQADANGDQMLSKSEVMLDAMKGFVASDLDGDGLLEANEVGDLAADPEFTVEEKRADFKAIDTNGDGFLSLEELNVAYPAPKE